MKLRSEYTLTFLPAVPKGMQFPMIIDLDGKKIQIDEISNDRKNVNAFIEGSVDPELLEIKVGPKGVRKSHQRRGIVCSEKDDFRYFITRIIHIISFLVDTPIRYSHKLGSDILIPVEPSDEKRLDEFGTRQIYAELSTSVSARTFNMSSVSDEEMKKLATKEVGMANYYQSLLNQDSISIYRDLWKVLETAFSSKDDDLILLLAKFKPAIDLGFTDNELKELLILRGRASHAESKSGMDELREVIKQTGNRLPRLKCLVEQVLITKKSWGYPSLGSERLAPLSSYIQKNGTLVIFKPRSNDK